MRKQHMALKAMMMANKPIPASKMSPYFKALDEIFSRDPSSSPLNRALEKCLGGKVKVLNPSKGKYPGRIRSPLLELRIFVPRTNPGDAGRNDSRDGERLHECLVDYHSSDMSVSM